jgi:FRG domain
MSFWSERGLLEAGGDAETLLAKVARITTWSTECRFVWRGHPDPDWKLHSALFHRIEHGDGAAPDEQRLRDFESDLLARASRHEFGGPPETPELQRMAILQHHGTATRLLDVTTDPMIALWFACAGEAHTSKQGVLFAIEVSFAVHLEWDHGRTVAEVIDGLGDEQLAVFWPRPVDARIQVQRGAFVLGPVPSEPETRAATSLPLRVQAPARAHRREEIARRQAVFGARGRGRPVIPSILAVRIPRHTKRRLLRILERSYGYTEETIYPDIDGFSMAHGRHSPLPR